MGGSGSCCSVAEVEVGGEGVEEFDEEFGEDGWRRESCQGLEGVGTRRKSGGTIRRKRRSGASVEMEAAAADSGRETPTRRRTGGRQETRRKSQWASQNCQEERQQASGRRTSDQQWQDHQQEESDDESEHENASRKQTRRGSKTKHKRTSQQQLLIEQAQPRDVTQDNEFIFDDQDELRLQPPSEEVISVTKKFLKGKGVPAVALLATGGSSSCSIVIEAADRTIFIFHGSQRRVIPFDDIMTLFTTQQELATVKGKSKLLDDNRIMGIALRPARACIPLRFDSQDAKQGFIDVIHKLLWPRQSVYNSPH
eukprot:GHVT01007473.1.p1 GENE.GHVT01007473.1~~GHVT01007473.1.p1  ORF type:complete len:311 (-),score=56.51 GHVT01007473.1:1055-1987(-)